MMRMSVIGVAVLCSAILVPGCAKKTPPSRIDAPALAAPELPPPPPPPPPPPDPAPAPPAALTEDELFARKTIDELNAERPLGDALFDLDRSSIREDARAVLSTNAEWMRRWRSTRITVEGHCDERGTSEYNLALGDRRAAAVRDYLIGLGVAPDRIVVVSKGKEAPVCTDQSDSCWQRNRRGHPVITAK